MPGSIANSQRHHRNMPCQVCGGWDTLARGKGQRCYGYRSTDGLYEYCTRPELAGSLAANTGGYAHKLGSEACACGQVHGGSVPVQPAKERHMDTDMVQVARRLWGQGQPATDTVVSAYLASRGITLPPPASLRYHAMCKHPTGSYIPAMLAAVTRWPSVDVMAIQRTWLQPDGSGKANLDENKMSLGSVQGGAVRLSSYLGPVLYIAEGVETAMTVQQLTSMPTWAVLGVKNMPGLLLPPLSMVREIVVAGDNDKDGIEWAHRAAQAYRKAGYKVEVRQPHAGYNDYNDFIRAVEPRHPAAANPGA